MAGIDVEKLVFNVAKDNGHVTFDDTLKITHDVMKHLNNQVLMINKTQDYHKRVRDAQIRDLEAWTSNSMQDALNNRN